jgi:hypothetical protein
MDFDDRDALLARTREVTGDGTWRAPVAELVEDAWISPPANRRPGRYGDAPMRFVPPDAGPWTFTLKGDPVGDEGTPTRWAAVLVAELPDDGFDVVPMAPSDVGGELTVTIPDATELWFIAIPLAEDYRTWETFNLAVRVQRPVDDAGGCAAAPHSMLALLLLPMAAVRYRRRRHERQ